MIDKFPFLIPGKLYKAKVKEFKLTKAFPENSFHNGSIKFKKNDVLMYIRSVELINNKIQCWFLCGNQVGFLWGSRFANIKMYTDAFEEV